MYTSFKSYCQCLDHICEYCIVIPPFLLPQIYTYMSLVFIILAIFSFCASTHKYFQINIDDDNIANKTILNISNSSNGLSSSVTQTFSSAPSETTTERTRGVDIISDSRVHPVLFYIDLVCLAFFTLEYLVRFVCAPNRCRFVFSFSAVVDILAILPDYLEFILYTISPGATQATAFVHFMPLLRLMRALRIFRLVRRVPGLWIMIYTLRASFKELTLMLVFLLVGTLFFSSVIYFVDDPDVFQSIPHGFWWAIVTMTTVGYGDVAPTTVWGKLVGSVTAICGVLLVGFTIPALVNNFITYYQHVEFVIKKERLMAELSSKERCKSTSESTLDDPETRYRLLSTDTITTIAPDGNSSSNNCKEPVCNT